VNLAIGCKASCGRILYLFLDSSIEISVLAYRTAYTEQKGNEAKVTTRGVSNFPASAVLPAEITLCGETT
jgi:hypothetical protein